MNTWKLTFFGLNLFAAGVAAPMAALADKEKYHGETCDNILPIVHEAATEVRIEKDNEDSYWNRSRKKRSRGDQKGADQEGKFAMKYRDAKFGKLAAYGGAAALAKAVGCETKYINQVSLCGFLQEEMNCKR
jgi:hypothetical protein